MDRKEIVKALGEHFGVKPEYLGVPSFAYKIEIEKKLIQLILYTWYAKYSIIRRLELSLRIY
jgi:hypothetical protein